MKNFIRKIEYLIDYYFVHLLYNESKFYRYQNYMKRKYGNDV